MQRHRALGGVEDKQFGPDEPQKRHLVSDLQFRKKGDVLGPLDGREEEPCRQLTDIVDAHDVVRLHALAVPGRGIRLGAQQQRDVGTQVGMAVVADCGTRISVGQSELAVQGVARGLRRWHSASLDSWWGEEKREQDK